MRAALPVVVFLAAGALWAGDRIGEAVYREGDVGVVRDGQQLESSAVQAGLVIENFDLVKTGPDGLLEARLASPRLTVKVSPNTCFSFEVSRLGGKEQSSIGLISGSLGLKVSRLASSQNVTVRTDSASMGVRGTAFTVTSPPSGDILVTCDEGEVVCTDESGKEAQAAPGTAVEKKAGDELRGLPVAVSDLDTFRANWLTERITALKSNAPRAIRDYARLYRRMDGELRQGYAALMRNQTVITKWSQEDRKGMVGGRIEVMREKKQVIGALFRLRKTLFLFERIYYRLAELEGYHAQGFGRGMLDGGESTDEFFRKLDAEKPDIEGMMAGVRYVAKLYAARNGGSVPADLFDDTDQGGKEDFFKD